jgi:hypothetical protein
MKRRHLEYAVIAGMLLTGTYVLVSGLLAHLLGFHQFLLHRWAGYTCAALALVHLALNRQRVLNYLRSLRRRPQRPAAPPVTPGAEVRPGLGRRGFLIGALAGLGGFLLGRFFPASRPPLRATWASSITDGACRAVPGPTACAWTGGLVPLL